MTKKNDAWCAKDPCKNGVQIGMVQLDFAADTASQPKPENGLIWFENTEKKCFQVGYFRNYHLLE
jgi:hypothetical protein